LTQPRQGYELCTTLAGSAVDLVEAFLLVKGAAHLRENVVGIRSDEPNRADYEHEDDSQHHGVFRNVLAFIREEKIGYISHGNPFDS